MKAPPVISVAKKTTSDAKYVRKAVADSSSHKHDSSSMKKEADNNDTKAAAPVINVAKKTMIDQNNYRVISKQIRDLLRQRKILVTKGSSTQTVDGQLSTLEQMRKAHGFNSKGDKTSEQLLEVANELRKERTYRYDAKLDTKGVIEELDKVKTMMRAEQLEKWKMNKWTETQTKTIHRCSNNRDRKKEKKKEKEMRVLFLVVDVVKHIHGYFISSKWFVGFRMYSVLCVWILERKRGGARGCWYLF